MRCYFILNKNGIPEYSIFSDSFDKTIFSYLRMEYNNTDWKWWHSKINEGYACKLMEFKFKI